MIKRKGKKDFIIIDIYGDEWVYTCENRRDAKECFIAENGLSRFESFLTNKNKDYIKND